MLAPMLAGRGLPQRDRWDITSYLPNAGGPSSGQSAGCLHLDSTTPRAGGQGVSRGHVIYTLVYGLDLVGGGHLGYTESEFGRLAYLNCAVPQWDEPMEHQTIYVHYPIEVSGEAVSADLPGELGLRTEPFMNDQYKIWYLGQNPGITIL